MARRFSCASLNRDGLGRKSSRFTDFSSCWYNGHVRWPALLVEAAPAVFKSTDRARHTVRLRVGAVGRSTLVAFRRPSVSWDNQREPQ